MLHYPHVNITMPVYNRHDLTVMSILSVHNRTKTGYSLNVVDNGSDPVLKKELLHMYHKNIIHNLHFLEKNYGISCACNTGWKLHPSSVYMKLDNDMIILSDSWLTDILNMWGTDRYKTIFGPIWHCTHPVGKCETRYGTFWRLPLSFSGAAFLVAQKTIDSIGYFCEDYGLYGEEDADYCLRCHFAGIRKYSYECSNLIRHAGTDDTDYMRDDINKVSLHNDNVGTADMKGVFALNVFLYEHKIKPLIAPLRYSATAIDKHHVKIEELETYKEHYTKLVSCLQIVNDSSLNTADKAAILSGIMRK